MEIRTVGVIGAGQMGSGIAEVALAAGYPVLMRDLTPELVERGKARIEGDLERRVQKGKMPAGEKEAVLKRLTATCQLDDLADCDLVVEAATENISLKGEIFKRLGEVVRREALLASNTSSISITRIASFTRNPDRVIGLHFFNPAPVMKLIEIVKGLATSEAAFRTAKDFCVKLGKTPLEAADLPGFVSSRLIFSYMNEAVFALYEGAGTAEDIDAIMKMGANHPMGPLELADYVGLDTVLSVMRVLQEAYGDKYRPCPLLAQHVSAGYMGVKSGRGFYSYGGKR